MKRQLLGVYFIIVMLFSVLFSAVSVKGMMVESPIARNNQKHVDLVLEPPEVVKVGDFDWLIMPNCSYVSTPGHPMLPIKSIVVKLPLKSNVTELVVNVENVSLKETYFVMPVPTPVQVSSNQSSNVTEPDHAIYGKDELYPKEWLVYRASYGLDPETDTRVQYLTLYFYPLRYLPTQKEIFFGQKSSFIISYGEVVEEQTVQMRLQNLVITSTLLESQALRLAQWKNSTGILSKVVTTAWIYAQYSGVDNPEKIRNCIKDFVFKHQILYVTIFGDADIAPVRYAYVPDGMDTYTPTDLYYADLDGTWDDNHDGIFADQRYDNVDGIPDVYVGRISVSLVSYATSTVTKIINYKNQDMSADWAKRIILAAGTGDGGGGNNLGNATTVLNEYISNVVSNRNIVKLYESFGNCTTALMLSETNEGAAFINFAGHGDPGDYTGAAGWLFFWVFDYLIFECFHVPLVRSLTNGWKLPVVTTMSCSTARFDDHECVGEWWLCNPNGGGIAYFGATRIAWTYIDNWAPYGLMGEMDRRIYEVFYEGYTKLSQMWGVPVTRYVQSHIWNYKYASKYDVKTLMEFVLLGDPTLRIYNGPETLKVPDEYATIQGAINAAYSGDRIQVASGTYYEHVVVNKSVSLIGENPISTIVDGSGSGDLISLYANDVVVENFTFQRGASGPFGGIAVYIDDVKNVLVKNIITRECNVGVILRNSSYTRIVGNNITANNRKGGIYVYYSSKNNITNNTFTNTGLYFTNSYQNVVKGNVVNGKPLVYLEDVLDYTVDNAGQVILINCSSIRVQNLDLSNTTTGLELWGTNNSNIANNSVINNDMGILLYGSSHNNSVVGNNMANNRIGIVLDDSLNNRIVGNNITTNNQNGIMLWDSSYNSIYHNNFVNNTEQVHIINSVNIWDNGYPSGGNYWSNYTGVDLFSGPYQNETGMDGIGDKPYVINTLNKDKYPLMKTNGWIQNTTITFSLNPNPAYLGQTLTLLGSLKDEYNRPLKDMEVSIYSNGTLLGRLRTNSTGGFYATGKPGSAGTYEIKVSFKGSETFRPSSYIQMLTILPKIDTKVSFSLSPNPANLGEAVTLAGNLTDKYGKAIAYAPVEVLYSIDNGVTWIYAGTLQTNSTGWFKAAGKLTIVGTYLVKVRYKGTFMYNPSYHIETLTVTSP